MDPTIGELTNQYETWLVQGIPMPPGPDLDAIRFKHLEMAGEGSAFPFLRATFYRWAERWEREAKSLKSALPVLAVGDLHIENFGTWRDPKGNLIWGINDFDEAWTLPWTSDLIRLGTSAALAAADGRFHASLPELCTMILEGYEAGLVEGKIVPFQIESDHKRLLKMVESAFKSKDEFWAPFHDAKSKWRPIAEPPPDAMKALLAAVPKGACIEGYREQRGKYIPGKREPAGLGSLGRPRYCVIASDAEDEPLIREAKAVLSSAAAWVAKVENPPIRIGELLKSARPNPDPWMRLSGQWIVRRIARKAVKISIEKLRKNFAPEDEAKLFRSMGRETANIHLASTKAWALLADFNARQTTNRGWYVAAVEDWRKLMVDDWKKYRATRIR